MFIHIHQNAGCSTQVCVGGGLCVCVCVRALYVHVCVHVRYVFVYACMLGCMFVCVRVLCVCVCMLVCVYEGGRSVHVKAIVWVAVQRHIIKVKLVPAIFFVIMVTAFTKHIEPSTMCSHFPL